MFGQHEEHYDDYASVCRYNYRQQSNDLRERNAEVEKKIDALLSCGVYVVRYEVDAYCNETSATLDVPAVCYEVAQSRWEADRLVEKLVQMTDCGRFEVLPRRAK